MSGRTERAEPCRTSISAVPAGSDGGGGGGVGAGKGGSDNDKNDHNDNDNNNSTGGDSVRGRDGDFLFHDVLSTPTPHPAAQHTSLPCMTPLAPPAPPGPPLRPATDARRKRRLHSYGYDVEFGFWQGAGSGASMDAGFSATSGGAKKHGRRSWAVSCLIVKIGVRGALVGSAVRGGRAARCDGPGE